MRILLILALLLIDIVAAQSIGVSPGYIEVHGKKGDIVKNSFTVLNPGEEQIYFEITSDNEFDIKPLQGKIPAGESSEITLTTSLDSSYETKILIKTIASGNKDSVSINAGISLRVKINVEEEKKISKEKKGVKKSEGLIIVVSILSLGLFSYFRLKKE